MRKSYIELAGGFYACYMFVVNIIYAAYDSTMYSELTPHKARKTANAWLTVLKAELEKEEKFQREHGFGDVIDFVRDLKS